MKKILSVLLCLCLFLGLFAGCSANKKDTIVFTGWTNSTESAAYRVAIKEFEKLHNVKVKYNTVAVGEYRSKLNSMLGADALTGSCSSDVFYVPYGMLWDKTVSGHIENLQPYIDADKEINLDEFWDVPGFYQYKLTGDEVGKGDIYAFPKDVGPMGMIYNKDLFKQYGVTAPTSSDPWNWDDLMREGVKINNTLSGGAKRNNWMMGGYNVDMAVWSNGASYLSEDKKTVTVDSAQFVQSLSFMRELIVKGIACNSTELASMDAYTRFTNGQIGMFFAGPWDAAVYNDTLDFDWDYLPLIAGPTGLQATSVGYMGLAMSSRSKHKDLAYELLKFLTTNETSQRSLYKAGQIVPSVKSMAKGEFIDYYKASRPNIGEWIDILERTGRPQEQFLTPSDAWMVPFTNGVGTVFNGDKSAAQFCAEVKADMQSKLDTGYREMNALKENVGWGK